MLLVIVVASAVFICAGPIELYGFCLGLIDLSCVIRRFCGKFPVIGSVKFLQSRNRRGRGRVYSAKTSFFELKTAIFGL